MLAIISGGSEGIGKSAAIELAKQGFDIIIASRNIKKLEKARAEIGLLSPKFNVFIHVCDFSSKEDIIRFSEEVKGLNKPVEILINNVGIYSEATVSEEKEGTLENMMQTNLYGAYHLTRSLIDQFKKQRRGHIFNICSSAAITPRTDAASYTISKFALHGFNKVLCDEMKKYNVKVTAVLPGPVNTPSWNGIPVDTTKLIQPEDIASAIINAYKMSPSSVAEEIIINPVNF